VSVRSLALAILFTLPVVAQEAPRRVILNGLHLRDYTATIDADEETATVVVEQTFYNGGGRLDEADFLFPMPAAAATSGLELKMGGRYYGGNLLRRSRARRIYDQITRRSRDPALLDCVGKDLYRCRVFPVPARGTASVKLAYKHPVDVFQGMRRLVVPLDASRFARRPADHFALNIRIRTKSALQAILCTTHDVSITRVSAREAFVTLEAHRASLAGDLTLLYSVDDAPIGAVVAAYRYPGRAGYFVLSVDAAFAREAQLTAPRDIVLAVDTSNSAGRNGVASAAAAVAEALSDLRPQDRFALMAFATEPRLLMDFRHVDQETGAAIRAVFAKQPVAGRTRVATAIEGAAGLAAKGLPGTGIVLLTDGVSTEHDGRDATEVAAATVDRGHRVGVCGIGADMDTVALDAIGQGGHGDSAYAVRGRGLSAGVRHLIETTRAVPLTDVSITVAGTHDVYPRKMRVIKSGESVLVAGRYTRTGVVSVTVRGRVAGKPVSRTLSVVFPKVGGDPAVARMWASRRVGHLLDEARRKGDASLHAATIRKLGHRFGIVTPHTSMLVLEESDQKRFLKGMQRQPLMNTTGSAAMRRRGPVTSERSGPAELAERIKRLSRARSGAVNPFGDLLGENLLRVRRAAGRTFYRSVDGVWVEAGLFGEKTDGARRVVFLSDAWQALREEHAAVLAVGRDVLFSLEDGTIVRVTEE